MSTLHLITDSSPRFNPFSVQVFINMQTHTHTQAALHLHTQRLIMKFHSSSVWNLFLIKFHLLQLEFHHQPDRVTSSNTAGPSLPFPIVLYLHTLPDLVSSPLNFYSALATHVHAQQHTVRDILDTRQTKHHTALLQKKNP